MQTTTVKVKLLKRYNRKNPGDILEVRPADAKVLKAVGLAEDYVEPTPRPARTTTRVMQPETTQTPPSSSGSSSSLDLGSTENLSKSEDGGTEEDSSSGGGFARTRTPYSRRDMKPEE